MLDNYFVLFYGTLIWSCLVGILAAKVAFLFYRLALMEAEIAISERLYSQFDWAGLDWLQRQNRRTILSQLPYRLPVDVYRRES